MAFFVNNLINNSRVFLKNDDILILNPSNLSNDSIRDVVKLKCSQVESAEDVKHSIADRKTIVSSAISICNTLLVACDSGNILHLFRRDDQQWRPISARSLARRCHKVIFTSSGADLLLVDRGGDVLSFSAVRVGEGGRFLLGHVSLILDIAISRDDRLLATGDRDGKIRISHYPNCYHTLAYCLGHGEFVSCLAYTRGGVLLSGSGDGTVRLWGQDGQQRQCVRMGSDPVLFSVRSIKSGDNVFAVLFHLQSRVALYELLDKDDFVWKLDLSLSAPPLDAVFVDQGILVLTKGKANVLQYFERTGETFVEKVPHTLDVVYEFYEDFDATFEDDFICMFKKTYCDEDESRKKNKVGCD